MAEQENTGDGSQASLFKAAQYVRMSTEHQQYSTENQGDKIKEYAAHRGIEIIKTYTDAGKSGLRIDGRRRCDEIHVGDPHRQHIAAGVAVPFDRIIERARTAVDDPVKVETVVHRNQTSRCE